LNIIGLLLAAGSASRFGSDKLRHALPHGVPIAVQAARNLKAELARIVVAVRAAEMRELFRAEGCDTVLCENANEGMGASLACAARAAGKADAYIVALADMPFVRPSTIGAVRDALAAGAALAAPYFRARRGHPVGIAGRFYEQLICLTGDEGARHLLSANESQLVKIPVGDPGAIRDIDRPEDLLPPLRV
jgi:molybdenum cofactor cytidylyltransferase